MSKVIASPRTSVIDIPDGECPHGMSDAAWCATCRQKQHSRGGVRTQVQANGGHCWKCDGYLHKGDLITLVEGRIHCQDCA